uniref:Uncharacterized protein n=1 Tax=Anguilla anguilla TaxID=7936 RepID=A0A0E9SMD1_ANGAN
MFCDANHFHELQRQGAGWMTSSYFCTDRFRAWAVDKFGLIRLLNPRQCG